MRIGMGYDIHRLRQGRSLVLGGVEIPFIKGLEGHSDADALLHAITDALLGAIGEGDIGEHFPDTDTAYKGINSMELLKKVIRLVSEKGCHVGNVDCVIIAEEPSIEPFKEKMKQAISGALSINAGQVNIKATTSEGVGSIGRGEAIAAYAVVLLE